MFHSSRSAYIDDDDVQTVSIGKTRISGYEPRTSRLDRARHALFSTKTPLTTQIDRGTRISKSAYCISVSAIDLDCTNEPCGV